MTECGVLPIQRGIGFVYNEELRGRGVVTVIYFTITIVMFSGTRHRNNTALVFDGIIDTVCGKFTNNRVLGTAKTGALRVTALNHKVFNYTVEDKAVIKALTNQLLEVCNGNGSAFGVELYNNVAIVFFAVIICVRNVELDIIGGCFGDGVRTFICQIIDGAVGNDEGNRDSAYKNGNECYRNNNQNFGLRFFLLQLFLQHLLLLFSFLSTLGNFFTHSNTSFYGFFQNCNKKIPFCQGVCGICEIIYKWQGYDSKRKRKAVNGVKEIRWERIAAIFVSILAGSALIYVAFRYALPLLLPFLLAFVISLFIQPIASKIATRTHLSRGVCSVILLLLVFGLGGWGLWVGSVRLFASLGNLVERLLSEGGILDAMDTFAWWLEQIGARFGFVSQEERSAQSFYDSVMQMVGNMLSSFASRLPEIAASLFSALPNVLFFLVVSVVACFYFCTDGVQITQGFTKLLPQKWQSKLPYVRKSMRDVFYKYLKAYGILLLLTFALLLGGFWILGIEYAFLLAFLIALADFLPVIGVGTILIPWGIVMLLQKNYFLGFGLLILYLVISLVRQVAEPKVLGKSLGLHPLLTLFATYVGFSLFGLAGMLLAPIVALFVKRLLSSQITK